MQKHIAIKVMDRKVPPRGSGATENICLGLNAAKMASHAVPKLDDILEVDMMVQTI